MQKLLLLFFCLIIYSSCSEDSSTIQEYKPNRTVVNPIIENQVHYEAITNNELQQLESTHFTEEEENAGKQFADAFIQISDAIDKNSITTSNAEEYFSFVETNILENTVTYNNITANDAIYNSLVSLSDDQIGILFSLKQIFENSSNNNQIKLDILNLVDHVKNTLIPDEQQIMISKLSNVYFTFSKLAELNNVNFNIASSRWGLPAIWAIAVVEPSPVGEIIATLITAGYAMYLINERMHCIDTYVACIMQNEISDCSSCLHFCVAQGYWNC